MKEGSEEGVITLKSPESFTPEGILIPNFFPTLSQCFLPLESKSTKTTLLFFWIAENRMWESAKSPLD